MKVGGGLNYVTGPMGAGKTLNGVRRIIDYCSTGRYALTNIELRVDWADRAARHVAPFAPPWRRRRVAASLERFYVYESDLKEAMRYRLPGRGEARGLVVWDEGQNDLNNRAWKEDGRAEVLEWATQLRKLGFVGYLLSQHHENTDAALRRICNFRILLQNQREQTRLLGLRVTPWPLFLAVWVPAHVPLANRGAMGGVQPVKVERYFLSWHRHLYDTMGLFHELAVAEEDGEGLIYLPAVVKGKTLPALPAGSQA